MRTNLTKRGLNLALLVLASLLETVLSAQPPPTTVATNADATVFDTNAPATEVRAAQINLSPALAEVVRLSQSGADESVVVAYVQKAPAYHVTADDIIYLQDLGISDAVLKAVVSNSRSAPIALTNSPTVAVNVGPTNVVATNSIASPPEPQPVAGAPVAGAPTPPPTAAEFYEPLTPYGSWVEVAPYGWCWQPSVVVINSGWRPYCDNGYWLWSDSGWYWHSYYSWGWAPFHYGRWFYHPHRRWVWAPDAVWGPSWVSWRYGHDYCGWAPLPPGSHFSVGVGWTYGGARVGSGFAFGLSANHYTFVSSSHFADRRLAARALPRQQVNIAYQNTTIINNYAVGRNQKIINQGVDRGKLEAAARTKIPEVTVRELPRGPQRVTMPDRVTRVGKADVVYRPGPDIQVPRRVVTPAAPVMASPGPAAKQPPSSPPVRPITPGRDLKPGPPVKQVETPSVHPSAPAAPQAPRSPPRVVEPPKAIDRPPTIRRVPQDSPPHKVSPPVKQNEKP